MELHRIHGSAYDAFDTTGTFLYSGRWHTRGSRVVYTSRHISLATLEALVHAGGKKLPPKVLTSMDLPDPIEIESAGPMEFAASQRFGDQWLAELRTAVLRVPSITVNNLEFNYLLNPAHPDFKLISRKPAKPYVFDVRLVGLREFRVNDAL